MGSRLKRMGERIRHASSGPIVLQPSQQFPGSPHALFADLEVSALPRYCYDHGMISSTAGPAAPLRRRGFTAGTRRQICAGVSIRDGLV
jgi:hypothetical protein